MNGKNLYHKYHCFQGTLKVLRAFLISSPPQDLPDHTSWVRGNGPLSPEAKARVVAATKLSQTGIPKSPEQREKMRQAKLGVPKSEAHRKAMSLAQLKRFRG